MTHFTLCYPILVKTSISGLYKCRLFHHLYHCDIFHSLAISYAKVKWDGRTEFFPREAWYLKTVPHSYFFPIAILVLQNKVMPYISPPPHLIFRYCLYLLKLR